MAATLFLSVNLGVIDGLGPTNSPKIADGLSFTAQQCLGDHPRECGHQCSQEGDGPGEQIIVVYEIKNGKFGEIGNTGRMNQSHELVRYVPQSEQIKMLPHPTLSVKCLLHKWIGFLGPR